MLSEKARGMLNYWGGPSSDTVRTQELPSFQFLTYAHKLFSLPIEEKCLQTLYTQDSFPHANFKREHEKQ